MLRVVNFGSTSSLKFTPNPKKWGKIIENQRKNTQNRPQRQAGQTNHHGLSRIRIHDPPRRRRPEQENYENWVKIPPFDLKMAPRESPKSGPIVPHPNTRRFFNPESQNPCCNSRQKLLLDPKMRPSKFPNCFGSWKTRQRAWRARQSRRSPLKNYPS